MPSPVVSWVRRASRSSSGRAMPRRSSVRSARSARLITTRPEPVLAGLAVLLDEARGAGASASSRDAVDLCRPSRRASSVTPASPWLSPSASRSAAARSTERTALPSSTIVASRSPRFNQRPGAPSRRMARHRSRRGRAPRAPRRASRRRSTRRGRRCRRAACASHMNHGSRESGSGIAPRACMPTRDRVVQLVVGRRPVAVLGRLVLAEHDPEHARMAGEVVRQRRSGRGRRAGRLDAPAGGMDRLERVRVAQDLERLDRRRRRDPVAGVRAAVADLVGQHAHDFASRHRTRRPGSRCPSPWRTSRGPGSPRRTRPLRRARSGSPS